jgi:hypothetical protein
MLRITEEERVVFACCCVLLRVVTCCCALLRVALSSAEVYLELRGGDCFLHLEFCFKNVFVVVVVCSGTSPS